MKAFFKLLLSNLVFMLACTGISALLMGFIAGWAFVTMVWFVWPFFAVFFALMFSFGGVKI